MLKKSFIIALMITCPIAAMHHQKSTPLTQNSTTDNEQWNNIKKLLLLSADNFQVIQNKVGTLPALKLHQFAKALYKLASSHVMPSEPPATDALTAAPLHHILIAENKYYRILWATLGVGERSNFHTHQWPSVLLTISPPITGITHTQDGTSLTETWSDDIEESRGDTEPLAFTNCGPHDFKALVVELKQTVPKLLLQVTEGL